MEPISLVTNPDWTHSPHAVLVFPVLWKRFIWVFHPLRGWEVPGGKIETNESPADAARRETWEEAGLRCGRMEWLGEYPIHTEETSVLYKWVYIAQVIDVTERPPYSEISDVKRFPEHLTPTEARKRNDVSFIMQDFVYESAWPILLHHPIFISS